MYKVIFLSMAFEDPRDQHNFSLLDESFDTVDEAREFVLELIEEDKLSFIDGVEDIAENVDFNVEEYPHAGYYEIDYEVNSFGDLLYQNEYKIVELQ